MKDFKVNGCTELTESDLDSVNGGMWWFNDTDGNGHKDTCQIDNHGSYHCNDSSSDNIAKMKIQNPGLSTEQYIAMALEKGYLW